MKSKIFCCQSRFDLPPKWSFIGSLEPKPMPAVRDVCRELEEELTSYFRSRSFTGFERSSKVAVIVDDDTRPTPVNVIAPLLVRALKHLGLDHQKIIFVTALGLHPPMTKSQLRERLGEDITGNFRVVNHNPDQDLEYFGETSGGVEVWVNRLVAEADFKVGIGTLAMHLLGYSGGPKIVMPGVTGRDTAKEFHLTALKSPEARWGRLNGNPFYESMRETAEKVGLDLVVDTIFNSEGEVAKVLAGPPDEVSRRGQSFLDAMFKVKPPQPVDVAIASSHPLDMNLFQGLKAAFAAGHITKDGGTIILVAPCTQGLGPYRDAKGRNMLTLRKEEVIEGMEEGWVNPSEAITPYLLRDLLRKKRIILVTQNLPKSQVEALGLEHSKNIKEALLKAATEEVEANVAILPKGASLFGSSRSSTAKIGKYPTEK